MLHRAAAGGGKLVGLLTLFLKLDKIRDDSPERFVINRRSWAGSDRRPL